MTENKRYSFNWERGHPNFWDNHCDLADCYLTCEDVVDRLNELHEENQELKKKNKQLSIDFMDFKMKLIEQLQIHYDYASEQRQKNLDDSFVAQAYDIIRYDVRNLAEEMRVDLE